MYVADGNGGHLLMAQSPVKVFADSINISSVYTSFGDGVRYPKAVLQQNNEANYAFFGYAFGLLSSLGSTAYALEDDFTFDLEGYYRMRGYSFSNLYADQDEPGRFIAQRLRLQPQLNYQDMAKFI